LAVVEYDIGNERRRQSRLEEARRAYERAVQNFPDFAEAHASLGATLHLLGVLDGAEEHYRAALLANPNLPGLDGNIMLLGRERAQVR
jgi:tetratricopeptide (TPR) repeat protein